MNGKASKLIAAIARMQTKHDPESYAAVERDLWRRFKALDAKGRAALRASFEHELRRGTADAPDYSETTL